MVGYNAATEGTGFWDSQTIETDIASGDYGNVVRVSRVTKGRRGFVDIRQWFVHRETGVLTPGKGIALPVDIAESVLYAGLAAASR
jgi:hypothetical protein